MSDERQERLRRDMDDPDQVIVVNDVKYWRVKYDAGEGPIPPFVYDDAGLPCPEAQRLAYEEDTKRFLAEFKRRPPPDAEQIAEMRNAFGPGETVVNVITGRRTKLPD